MLLIERFTALLQEELGQKYLVLANDAFSRQFTTPTATPYGLAFDINYQAFSEYADTAVAVLQLTPINLTHTEYYIRQAQYTLNFWLPIDTKESSNFYGDIKRLIERFSLPFSLDESNPKKLLATMSEPTLSSASVDGSGTGQRVSYQVTGTISMFDDDLATGEDLQIFLYAFGVEAEVKNASNVSISSTTDNNLLIKQGMLKGSEEPSVNSFSITFSVYDDKGANWALLKIKEKAFGNKEILTPEPEADTERKKRKVKTTIYHLGVPVRSFWAIMSVTYSNAGKTSFGEYTVTLVDSGE